MLEATLESQLMLVNPDKFIDVMQQNPDSLILTTTYAKNFCAWIAGVEPDSVSDIFQGGVHEDAHERHMKFMELEDAPTSKPCEGAGKGPFGLRRLSKIFS